MENEKHKRITAHLIPYKIEEGKFFFFLQKRSNDDMRHPGWFTIFGGGVEEGENREQAMLREIKEELDFVPIKYFYLGKYEDNHSVSDCYATEVGDSFEGNIKIGEGDYGKFFSEEDIKNENKLSENNKKILNDLIIKIV